MLFQINYNQRLRRVYLENGRTYIIIVGGELGSLGIIANKKRFWTRFDIFNLKIVLVCSGEKKNIYLYIESLVFSIQYQHKFEIKTLFLRRKENHKDKRNNDVFSTPIDENRLPETTVEVDGRTETSGWKVVKKKKEKRERGHFVVIQYQ